VEIVMGKEVEYKCKCGYEHFESDGGSMAEFMLEETSYCKSCGLAQIYISDNFYDEEEFPVGMFSEPERQGIIDAAYGKNNKNRCKECNGELERIVNDEYPKIMPWVCSDYNQGISSTTLECKTCKEFRQTYPVHKKYYLDTKTKKVLKEVEVKGDTCNECNSKMVEIKTNNDKVKCPKCNKFDMEERTMFFD